MVTTDEPRPDCRQPAAGAFGCAPNRPRPTRWCGKLTSVETVEDLQVLERALRAVAASGKPEAPAR